MASGNRLDHIDRSLGFGLRPILVRWVADHPWADIACSVVYYGAHVSIPVGVGIVLAVRHPAAYRRFRSIFLTAHAITITCYLAWPTTPPRLLPDDDGIVPVDHSVWTHVQSQYAAFPSGHVVFAAVVGVVLVSRRRRWVRVGGVVYPTLVALVTLATDNHYAVDVVAAVTIVAVVCTVAAIVSRLHVVSRVVRVEGVQVAGTTHVVGPSDGSADTEEVTPEHALQV